MPGEERPIVSDNRAAWADNVDYTKRGALCRQCGYLLRELPEDRCPECGRTFDRRDPQTMKIPGYRKPTVRRQPTFGEQIMLASIMATLYTVVPAQFACGMWLLGVGLWVAICVAWARRENIARVAPEQLRMSAGPRWRGFVKIMLLISIIGSVRFHQCYHATTLWLGPFGGLSYSDKGGPCGNDPHHGGHRLSGNFYYAN